MGSEPQPATGDGFRLAAELLGSGVTRRIVSVYELRPDELGLFDIVFMSDLIQHLRDPQLALERVFSVMKKPGGVLILAEEYSHRLAQYAGQALMEFRSYQGYTWWIPSVDALRLMLNVAGFGDVREAARLRLKFDGTYHAPKVVLHARR